MADSALTPEELNKRLAESDKRIEFLTTQVGALMRAVNTLVEDRRATASIEQPAASSLQEHALPATLPMAENQTGKEQPAALPVAEDSVNKEQPVARPILALKRSNKWWTLLPLLLTSSLPRRKNSLWRSPISLMPLGMTKYHFPRAIANPGSRCSMGPESWKELKEDKIPPEREAIDRCHTPSTKRLSLATH